MRCVYEVPRIILLQIFLYTYSLVSVATFKVVHLSSHTLSPVMLPLLETFMEHFFQNNLQCCCYIFLSVFNVQDCNYVKNQKSERAK